MLFLDSLETKIANDFQSDVHDLKLIMELIQDSDQRPNSNRCPLLKLIRRLDVD